MLSILRSKWYFSLSLLFLFCNLAYADQTLTQGEGITLTSSGAGGTLTVAGEDATDTNKGIATFNTANFATASGDITIKSGGVDLTDEVTGTLPMANGGTGVTTLTDGGILLGNAGTDIQAMAVLANGSIVVGDGTTDPVALAAFTNSTGDLKHEAGGLEADVSAYSGLIKITGGTTSNVTDKAGLEGCLTDVADIAEADGDTYTGAHDFGGATSTEIVNSTDPDIDAAGEVSYDTDDNSIRGFDGTNQIVLGQKIKFPAVTITEPDQLAETTNLPIWPNRSGFTFNITAIYSWSDDDNTDFTLIEINDPHDFTAVTTIEVITIATDGTGVYYNELTSGIDHTAIEDTHLIAFDNNATDTPDYISFVIEGYYDANVD